MPKYDLSFNVPVLNAAGSLGFAPDPHGAMDLSRLGAFVTNPVSLRPRTPAQGTRYLIFPGGFLLHTGYPNPGIRSVIRRYAGRWERSPMPIIVHLLPQRAEDAAQMSQNLEALEGVMGLELGLPSDVTPEETFVLAQAAVWELPVVVRLPLERAVELAPVVIEAGASAVSLGPPRGALPGPGGEIAQGRLYGPALFPLVLEVVRRLGQAGIPVIAAGGVYHPQDVETLLAAGAMAVQLDAVLWRGGWGSGEEL